MESETSVLEFIDSPQVTCLNESPSHTLKDILAGKTKNTDASSYLLSDADEQLLLNIPFNQTVKIRSFTIQTSQASQAPLKVKLFINRPSLGFEDVEDAEEPEAAQVFELSEAQSKEGKKIALRFVRFQSVNSLHIFVASNAGGEDETRIDAIDIFGTAMGSTKDLSAMKKEQE